METGHWYQTHDNGLPTETTEAILRIDRELRLEARNRALLQKFLDQCVCVTCGKSGDLHTHVFPHVGAA